MYARHWKDYIFSEATAVCFLYDTRLKFLENGTNGGKGAQMSCAMVYWGRRFETFSSVFLAHGAVLDLRPLHGASLGFREHIRRLEIAIP